MDKNTQIMSVDPVALMTKIEQVIELKRADGMPDFMLENYMNDLELLKMSISNINYFYTIYGGFEFSVEDDEG
jgi:hypothetical protein